MTLKQLYLKNSPVFNRGQKYCVVVSRKPSLTEKTVSFFVRTVVTKSRGRNIVVVKLKMPANKLREIFKAKEDVKFKSVEVKVTCTCEAMQFWGAAYNLTKSGSKLGHKENIAPEIRDPEGKVLICKHIARVYKKYGNLPIHKVFSSQFIKV